MKFPWLSHRDMREVRETELLVREWHSGAQFSHEKRRRLTELLRRSVGYELPEPPPTAS